MQCRAARSCHTFLPCLWASIARLLCHYFVSFISALHLNEASPRRVGDRWRGVETEREREGKRIQHVNARATSVWDEERKWGTRQRAIEQPFVPPTLLFSTRLSFVFAFPFLYVLECRIIGALRLRFIFFHHFRFSPHFASFYFLLFYFNPFLCSLFLFSRLFYVITEWHKEENRWSNNMKQFKERENKAENEKRTKLCTCTTYVIILRWTLSALFIACKVVHTRFIHTFGMQFRIRVYSLFAFWSAGGGRST